MSGARPGRDLADRPAPALLDLFSGIGGFSLGLERAGFRTVAFCEVDPFCRSVLSKHWPNVPKYDDVRKLTSTRLCADGVGRVDAICGGFPCQDISAAGSRSGLEGERSGLWREFARIVREVRPRFAIVENVGALRGRGLAAILGDFAALGFDAEWHAIPAAAIGAPHLRDRVWIIATAADSAGVGRKERGGLFGPLARALAATSTPWARTSEPAFCGMDDGLPAWVDGCPVDRRRAAKLKRDQDRSRTKALGNAVVPAIPEIIGRALLGAVE